MGWGLGWGVWLERAEGGLGGMGRVFFFVFLARGGVIFNTRSVINIYSFLVSTVFLFQQRGFRIIERVFTR